MNIRSTFLLLSILVVVVLALPNVGNAQRAARGKVQALDSVTDKSGPHPSTAAIPGPAKITCVNAVSETLSSRPAPSCHVSAPGFNGTLNRGQSASTTAAGDVTLRCNGQGYLRCNIRIDIPPPSK